MTGAGRNLVAVKCRYWSVGVVGPRLRLCPAPASLLLSARCWLPPHSPAARAGGEGCRCFAVRGPESPARHMPTINVGVCSVCSRSVRVAAGTRATRPRGTRSPCGIWAAASMKSGAFTCSPPAVVALPKWQPLGLFAPCCFCSETDWEVEGWWFFGSPPLPSPSTASAPVPPSARVPIQPAHTPVIAP